MARLKLTTAAVERLKPPGSGQVDYFDKYLPSFGIRVSHSGTKAWFVMTRVHGRQTRLTLGRYPSLSLQDARSKARQSLQQAGSGIDPRKIAEEERRKRQADARNTFGVLAEEFMASHVRPNLRPATVREYQRILFGHDTSAWRERPVTSIQRRDIQELLSKIDARGAKTASTLSLAYLRKFFNWCVDQEVVRSSPAARIKRVAPRSRERVLTTQELALIWESFHRWESLFSPLFRLLTLTGQRRTEVAGMRWDELKDLNGKAPLWEIPSARTKNKRPHIVPLSPQAARIIFEIQRVGPLVFSTNSDRPPSGFSKAKARTDKWLAEACRSRGTVEIESWTLHDLRRTMVTVMNEHLKVAPHIVEAVVNHMTGPAKAGVAGVYNRALYLEERRRALDDWARFVAAA